MATFVVAHGAWSAGWAWAKMPPPMQARGHRLITPTLTGLGERAHLARPDIDLDAHIADIVAVLEVEDLSGINLIGHSYGGLVATGTPGGSGARPVGAAPRGAAAGEDLRAETDLAARAAHAAAPLHLLQPPSAR